MPQVQRRKGHLHLFSSSPLSPAHEFVGYINEAISDGEYIKRTIDENPTLTKEEVSEYEKQCRGRSTTMFRREYLAEIITETERAVVPEFNDSHIAEAIERPQFCDKYVFMDLGLIDFTHVLFGYYDFNKAQLVIEDEIVQNHAQKDSTTKDLAEKIKNKEKELWGEEKPCLRVSDNDAQQLYDLQVIYGLYFTTVNKRTTSEDESLINQLRQDFQKNKIIVSDKVKTLIFQLKTGIWNEKRSDYERTSGAGHLDGVDALKYGRKMVNYNHNPMPVYHGKSFETHNIPFVRPTSESSFEKLGWGHVANFNK